MYRCMSFPLALQVGMYVLEVSKQWNINMCPGYIMLQQCRLYTMSSCAPPLESLLTHAISSLQSQGYSLEPHVVHR